MAPKLGGEKHPPRAPPHARPPLAPASRAPSRPPRRPAQDATEAFATGWLRQHIADAKALNKPLVLEEFGAWGVGQYKAQRDRWYELVYDTLAADAAAGGPTAGGLFWQLYAPLQRAPAEEGGGDGGLFGVFEADATWQQVARFTAAMRGLSGGAGGRVCAASRPPAPRGVRDCGSTRVKGRPGTGYEGPNCTVDINECARGTAGCDANAGCANAPGAYACACHQGFSGDGFKCASSPAALAAIQAGYFSAGASRVACEEGKDVVYPAQAPGWAYDELQGWDKVKDSPWKVSLQRMRAAARAEGVRRGAADAAPPPRAGRVWVARAGAAAGLHAGLQRCARLRLVRLQRRAGAVLPEDWGRRERVHGAPPPPPRHCNRAVRG